MQEAPKQSPIQLDRKQRRQLARGLGKKILPQPRLDLGVCYFCDSTVFQARGQAIKHITIGGITYPTHKECRKTGITD